MTAPIGLFDSGLGGLTVVRHIFERLPSERILYVADQAHVPYGGRPLDEVRNFACAISDALLDAGCQAVVMACNISSAVALPVEQAWHPNLPLIGVILPGAQAAAARSRNGRIGVLATEGTVRSGAYTRALHALNPRLAVTEVACPAFVPLVESGREESPEAEVAACAYLAPLRAAEVDVVILGCTHYPFLLPILNRLCPKLEFLDPAEQTVLCLSKALDCSQTTMTGSEIGRNRLFTTGHVNGFRRQLLRFLPGYVGDVEVSQARWYDRVLRLE